MYQHVAPWFNSGIGHLRGQSSGACVFLEFRRLSWIALAPAKSSSTGAGCHTGTNGAFVEGFVALGLIELDDKRRDGIQAFNRRRWGLRVNVDGLRLERSGNCDVHEGLFLFLWRRLRR